MNGYYCFSKPIGYAYKKVDGHGKMLVRDEPLASLIQEGLEGFASGRFETQGEVLRFLAANSVFPKDKKGNVHFERVKEILTRPVYAGYVEAPSFGISLRQGRHDPLISFTTFQRIQERLSEAAKAPARKDLNADFPLRGAVICGDCGTPLTAYWSTGRKMRHPYYLCRLRGCESYGKSIRRDDIEGEFAALLTQLQPSDKAITTARKMFRIAWDYREKSSVALCDTAKAELVTIDRQIGQLLDRVVEAINPTVIRAYEERIDTLEKQKMLLTEKLAHTGRTVKSFDETFRTALTFLSNPQKLWTSGILEEKRMVLRLAFADKLAYARNKGFRTANLALPFKALAGFGTDHFEMVHPKGVEPLTA